MWEPMKRVYYLLCTLLFSSLVMADETTDKIRVGMTQDEVISLMGSKPYDSDCSTTVGVKACKLFWKKATFDKNSFTAFFYDVTLIADRVVSTNVLTKQGVFK
jgi:hypothetical protein